MLAEYPVSVRVCKYEPPICNQVLGASDQKERSDVEQHSRVNGSTLGIGGGATSSINRSGQVEYCERGLG